LFKTFENAAPTSIRAQQSSTYSEKMVDFITVPRSINKTDAVGLVSNFGSIRTAINAGPEEIGLIAGWGDKKVQRWSSAVREPFRIKKAARRGQSSENTRTSLPGDLSMADGQPLMHVDSDAMTAARENMDRARPAPTENQNAILARAISSGADGRPDQHFGERITDHHQQLADDEEALREAEMNSATVRGQIEGAASQLTKKKQEELSDGVMAALSKLRKQ
jgi:hypothetical protein